MSTFADSDGCTDIILDFIAGGVPGNPSGESLGNYNAIIGQARSRAELSRRTLLGIYGIQWQLVSQRRPSTAIGRYQILRGTLHGLQAQMRLPDSERFTHALQDRLAVALLVRRGYSDWWRLEITDADFAHGLACEWASLPDPYNYGRSHYDGDVVGNHASTTLDAVYAMLRRARAAMPVKPGS